MNGTIANSYPHAALSQEIPQPEVLMEKDAFGDVLSDSAFSVYVAGPELVVDWNEPFAEPSDAPEAVRQEMRSGGEIFRNRMFLYVPLGLIAVGIVDNGFVGQRSFNTLEDLIALSLTAGIAAKTWLRSQDAASERNAEVAARYRNREQREDGRLRVMNVDRRFDGEPAATLAKKIETVFVDPKLVQIVTQDELLSRKEVLECDKRVGYLGKAAQQQLPLEGSKQEQYEQALRLVVITGSSEDYEFRQKVDGIDTKLLAINKKLERMARAESQSLTRINVISVLKRVVSTGIPIESIISELYGMAHYSKEIWLYGKREELGVKTVVAADGLITELGAIMGKVVEFNQRQAELQQLEEFA